MGHISFGHRRQVLLAATLVAAALSVTACGGNKNVRGDAPGMPQAGMNGQGQGQGQGHSQGQGNTPATPPRTFFLVWVPNLVRASGTT